MGDMPDEIARLIERFQRNREAYRAGRYKEASLRREFVEPLFVALGWDVYNVAGYAEAYKDVIHEDAIKVGGVTKAPDYCFRVGGARKFFVEAKKPAVDIAGQPGPAYQLRRYAWSAKLPLSVLTDFEEFAVYDCRVRPRPRDKPSVARTLYLTCEEYADRWGEIAGVFGKQAVLEGSFDRYVAGSGKRGTAEVDAEFLKEIEAWRDALARNIALRNGGLGNREINFAVQRTIDRIIFLRIAEDRGVERYGSLQALIAGDEVYARLMQLFRAADDRYNSGLFHFNPERDRPAPDTLTPDIRIDDKVLKDILRGLYYPASPYEFSVLPADILGNVYEQFLGKVIHLAPGHRARVEDKPEVKKAGGVYYTPRYIVDYIVRQTVGRLVEGKTPRQVSRLRVLDPACGSGSFLVGAYKFLLDHHRDFYLADGADKHRKRLYQGAGGQWHLTTEEKKRILLNNIHGVDIDAAAVEVTKLNLLLCVLENENQTTIGQLALIHQRALPDLAGNVKCGNSLIGPDFYQGRQLDLFDDEARLRINAFDWNAEFPEVFSRKNSGFDAVIGNPPWGQKGIAEDETVREYIRARYPSAAGIYDLFRPFVERAVKLLKGRGLFGMVLPDIVLLKDYPRTRRYLLDNLRLDAIEWWGMAFADAVIDAATIVGRRGPWPQEHSVRIAVHDGQQPLQHEIPQSDFADNPRHVFNLFLTPAKRRAVKRLEAFPKLGDSFEIHEGVHSGNIRKNLFVETCADESCEELLFGRNEITPYHLAWNGRYIRLAAVPKKKTPGRYANIGHHDWHRNPKVLVRRTGDYVLAAVDALGRFASNNFFLVFPRDECGLDLYGLCALLNSRFITWYFRTIEPRQGRVFAELKIKHLRVFPMPPDVRGGEACGKLNRLGRERTRLAQLAHEHLRTPQEGRQIERSCDMLDQQIEDTIGQAFGLTPEVQSQLAEARQ